MKRTPCLIAALMLLAGLTQPVLAQRILSDDELLSQTRHAWQRGDWVSVYGHLMAYVQRGPAEMSDASYAGEIRDALGAAYRNARAVQTAARRDDDSAGFYGKGDTAASAAAFDLPAKPRKPRAYRMECRGGGQMSANYYPRGGHVLLQINLRKAPFAARARAPAPGECAWVDRPIGQKEPFWLEWRFSRSEHGIDRIMFGSDKGVRGLSLQPNTTKYVSALIMEVEGTRLERLVSAIHRGDRFAVDCYNDRSGHFIVTRVYP